MSLYKNKYRIETARLPGWDYSSAAYYFITICTHGKQPFFGLLRKGRMDFSKIGRIAEQCWMEIPIHFPQTQLHEHVVMPNHVHGIIRIVDNVPDQIVETQNFAPLQKCENPQNPKKSFQPNAFGPQLKNIGSIIRGYKIGATKWCTMQNINFSWQHRFYDHIIRDNRELYRIRKYIIDNPKNWQRDRNYYP